MELPQSGLARAGWAFTPEEQRAASRAAGVLVNERGAIVSKELLTGETCDVIPLLGGRARITVSRSPLEAGPYDGW